MQPWDTAWPRSHSLFHVASVKNTISTQDKHPEQGGCGGWARPCPGDGAEVAGKELLVLKQQEKSVQDTQATPGPGVRCKSAEKSQLCHRKFGTGFCKHRVGIRECQTPPKSDNTLPVLTDCRCEIRNDCSVQEFQGTASNPSPGAHILQKSLSGEFIIIQGESFPNRPLQKAMEY